MVTPLARFEPLLSALKPEFFTTLPWRSPPGGKGPTSFYPAVIVVQCRVPERHGCVCVGGGVVLVLKIPIKIKKDGYLSREEL